MNERGGERNKGGEEKRDRGKGKDEDTKIYKPQSFTGITSVY